MTLQHLTDASSSYQSFLLYLEAFFEHDKLTPMQQHITDAKLVCHGCVNTQQLKISHKNGDRVTRAVAGR